MCQKHSFLAHFFLYRLLIACFSKSTNDYNTYDTRKFFSGRKKSLATKNDYRKVEFYDKQDEVQEKVRIVELYQFVKTVQKRVPMALILSLSNILTLFFKRSQFYF